MNKMIEHTSKRVYTVTLIWNGDAYWHMYRCPDCANYLIQYQGELVRENVGISPHNLPFMIQCSNKNCKRKVQFIATVREA